VTVENTTAKIICTIGPSCKDKSVVRAMVENGADMFRLNVSHGGFDEHENAVRVIREVENELGVLIPIMIDLQGPKIRLGELKEPISITIGDFLKFAHRDFFDGEVIPVDYEGIAGDLQVGDSFLIDDGKVNLRVVSVDGDVICAEVLTGEILRSRKGLNIPGATGSLNVMSARDVQFVEKAKEWGVDFIGLSFVRSAEDVKYLQNLLKDTDIQVIAKVEKPQALDEMDEIIRISDGILIARGDLGVETAVHRVPIIQKQLIEKANFARKFVIVSTQMLESMVSNPIPTRAEVSDVANAIFDGADAVLLTTETTLGNYPVEAVKMIRKIANDVTESGLIEKDKLPQKLLDLEDKASMAIGVALTDMVKTLPEVKAIVTISQSGHTPRIVSESNPSVPIFACCSCEKRCRQLKLYKSVIPLNIEGILGNIDESMLEGLSKYLIENTFLEKGDMVIVTGSVPHILEEATNFIKVHTL